MTTFRKPRSIAVPDDLKPLPAHDARIARLSILGESLCRGDKIRGAVHLPMVIYADG